MVFKIHTYLRTMAPSFVLLLFIAYGMATKNPWFQFGGIFVILAIQIGYQIFKSARSSPLITANVQEASRSKRAKQIFSVTEQEIRSVRANDKGSIEGAQAGKMMLLLVIPAGVLFGTTFLINYLSSAGVLPPVQEWQSFAVGFLISMPVSAILAARTGIAQSGPIVTPESYIVTERGVAFNQMNRSFIIRFPLKSVNLGKNGNAVEIEGFSEAPLIPSRLRLYTQKAAELYRILSSHEKKS